jgi:hypothetical protein
VRVLASVLCLGLSGCSHAIDNLPDAGDPPAVFAVVTDIKAVALEAKLANPLEVAGPIRAHPISSVPWIICLRSQLPDTASNRTYALFFKDRKLVSSRMTALVDECESQKFFALHDSTEPAAASGGSDRKFERLLKPSHRHPPGIRPN